MRSCLTLSLLGVRTVQILKLDYACTGSRQIWSNIKKYHNDRCFTTVLKKEGFGKLRENDIIFWQSRKTWN